MEELKLQAIGKKFRIPLEKCTLPTQEEIETLVGQRVIASLETTLREKGFLQKERIDAFVKLAVSMIRRGTPSMVIISSMISRVVSSISVTMARCSCKISFRRENLPTFGFPMMAVFNPSLSNRPVSKVSRRRSRSRRNAVQE